MYEFRVAPHKLDKWCVERRFRGPKHYNPWMVEMEYVTRGTWPFRQPVQQEKVYDTKAEAIEYMEEQQQYWFDIEDMERKICERSKDESLYYYGSKK